jgi:hypothetical protein
MSLDLDIVREQADDPAAAVLEARRLARRVERVDLAVTQHARQGLVRADRRQADVRRQVQLLLLGAAGLLLAAGQVGDAVDRHAVVVGEDAADPGRRGHLVFGIADAAADQVLGLPDAGAGMDVDRGRAEEASAKPMSGTARERSRNSA